MTEEIQEKKSEVEKHFFQVFERLVLFLSFLHNNLIIEKSTKTEQMQNKAQIA